MKAGTKFYVNGKKKLTGPVKVLVEKTKLHFFVQSISSTATHANTNPLKFYIYIDCEI